MPWSRPERIALAILVLGVFGSLAFLVHPWYEPTNDGSMYIATARSIVRGEGYSMLGIPFRIRPPGFSYVLAALIAWRGTDFLAFNLLVSLFGAVGVLLLYLTCRERIGWLLAWLVAASVWLNPGYQSLCNQPMSDVPGTTLLLACLLLERRSTRRGGLASDGLLGVAIGLSAYVRSVDVLLVPAIAVARLASQLLGPGERAPWKRWGARIAVLVAGAALVQAPWALRNRAIDVPEPVDQTLLASYSSGMWHVDPGDPGSPRLPFSEVLGRFPRQTAKIAAVLGNRMTDIRPGRLQDLVTLFLLASSAYVLVKRRAPPEIFVAGTLVIVAFYFGFAPRLLLPVYVLVLPAAAELVRDAAVRIAGKRIGTGVAAGALLGLTAVDFAPRRGWDRLESQHRFYTELCAEFEAQLAPDARLASQRGWHYAAFLDRPVYSLEFAVQRVGRPAAAEEVIDRYDLNTVILSPLMAKDREILPYFFRRYGERRGRALVYRVRD